jgi:RNA polymerase sigma-70 factor, ECF subfamily
MVKDHASVVPEGWLEEHGDALWRYAVARAPTASIEDVIQETLVAAVRAWPTFDRRSAVRTWLIGILSHKITDLYRRRAREGSLTGTGPDGTADLAPEGSADEFTPEGRWRTVPSSWAGFSDAALLAAMRECRERMPPILRDAIELRDLRQLSSEVVCQELGITPTNLWTRLHRARLALRRCIDGSMKDAPREERP